MIIKNEFMKISLDNFPENTTVLILAESVQQARNVAGFSLPKLLHLHSEMIRYKDSKDTMLSMRTKHSFEKFANEVKGLCISAIWEKFIQAGFSDEEVKNIQANINFHTLE